MARVSATSFNYFIKGEEDDLVYVHTIQRTSSGDKCIEGTVLRNIYAANSWSSSITFRKHPEQHDKKYSYGNYLTNNTSNRL